MADSRLSLSQPAAAQPDASTTTSSKMKDAAKRPATVQLSADVIINEVLCFSIGKFTKIPAAQLKIVLCNFYNDDELSCAKDLLIHSMESVSTTPLPRYPKRKGDSKGRLIVDDIMDILTAADEGKLIDCLPRFAAVNLERVPSFKCEDVDVFVMARKIEAIESRLSAVDSLLTCDSALLKKLDAIDVKLLPVTQSMQSGGSGVRTVASADTIINSNSRLPVADECTVGDNTNKDEMARADVRSSDNQTISWVSVAALRPGVSEDDADFVPVSRAKKNFRTGQSQNAVPQGPISATHSHSSGDAKKRKLQIRGVKQPVADSSLRSCIKIVKKLVLHVDNLNSDCTAEILRDFLTNQHIEVYTCFTAKSWMRDCDKEGVNAFRVCISAECKNAIYDPSIWPEGVIIREWKFTSTKNGARS